MYYPSSENKGADQLPGYREADLRLCFRICKNLVFSRRGSHVKDNNKLNCMKCKRAIVVTSVVHVPILSPVLVTLC